MSFPSQAEYEQLIYALPQENPDVVSSSLHLFTASRSVAIVRGRIQFRNGLVLRVNEVIDLVRGQISDYGYVVFRGEERVRWYDPQPHPEDSTLAATFPHHYHEPPDIKRNRKPAPGISFTAPNLAILIADCVELNKTLV